MSNTEYYKIKIGNLSYYTAENSYNQCTINVTQDNVGAKELDDTYLIQESNLNWDINQNSENITTPKNAQDIECFTIMDTVENQEEFEELLLNYLARQAIELKITEELQLNNLNQEQINYILKQIKPEMLDKQQKIIIANFDHLKILTTNTELQSQERITSIIIYSVTQQAIKIDYFI